MVNNEQYINEAVAQFETLLREQYARAEKMMNAPDAVDYAKLDKIIIGCCGGDGIGPIITAEARRVLEYLLKDAVARMQQGNSRRCPSRDQGMSRAPQGSYNYSEGRNRCKRA